MTGPERVALQRGFPSRAWSRLGWYLTAGSVVVVVMFVLFGSEPRQLESGRTNMLAVAPIAMVILFAVASTPFVLALFRRPLIAADHYALTVRPGILRTLMVPWARIIEVAAYAVSGEPFLLVRCGRRRGGSGDWPRWWDRTVLRAAVRGGRAHSGLASSLSGYDVAVRLDEFAGSPAAHLATLAAFAPDHVMIADELRSS